MIVDRLATRMKIGDILIEQDCRLDGVNNHGVADDMIEAQAQELCHRARGGHLGFLQPLQPLEFPACGTSPDESIQSQPAPGIKFQIIADTVKIKPPYLAIGPMFDQGAVARQLLENIFKRGWGHIKFIWPGWCFVPHPCRVLMSAGHPSATVYRGFISYAEHRS